MNKIARKAIVTAAAIVSMLPAVTFAEELFGPIHMAVNRHQFRGRCPVELIFTGTIDFVPHRGEHVINYSFDRSDGARGPQRVVHIRPGQRSLVVRDGWRMGGRGRDYDASVTLHVNSGNSHLRESSPTVHVECR